MPTDAGVGRAQQGPEAARLDASSGRRRSTPSCRRWASSTITSRAAPCAPARRARAHVSAAPPRMIEVPGPDASIRRRLAVDGRFVPGRRRASSSPSSATRARQDHHAQDDQPARRAQRRPRAGRRRGRGRASSRTSCAADRLRVPGRRPVPAPDRRRERRRAAAAARLAGERIQARVDELLELVELDPALAARLPAELSGGQQQRVGVARALAAAPRVMLLDEPFGALDPLTRDRLQQSFVELRRRLGLTAVIVTHDMAEALLLADRVAVMRGGRLVQVGDAGRAARARPPTTTWPGSSRRRAARRARSRRASRRRRERAARPAAGLPRGPRAAHARRARRGQCGGRAGRRLVSRVRASRGPRLGVAGVVQTIPAWRCSR